ncbi:MAG: hypothetical protein NVSMB24_40190 [Mucilaginibacter sp.]
MSKVFTITEGLENMGALSTGGQGSVYKARRLGEIISAVKILPTPVQAENLDDKNFRNFQNEVDKLKKVNQIPNPNIVKILNSGITESGSFPFIEMEFIEGPDLEELLRPPHDNVFIIREVLKVAEQLGNALSHCHSLGVKHGDIKSNNVKYNLASGNYVLLDFGMAIMSDEQRRTSMRQAGAIEFMAPEQNEGKILPQTDIYSYGIILYELLAGQVPFPLNNNGETSRNNVMVAHLEAEVPDLLTLRRKNLPDNWTTEKKSVEMQVPHWLLSLIAKCLEKHPKNRFANGSALQSALIEGNGHIANSVMKDSPGFEQLEKENERLKSLVWNAGKESQSGFTGNASKNYKANSSIEISKDIFKALIIVLSILFVFTTFWFTRKKSLSAKSDTRDTASHSNKAVIRDSTQNNLNKVYLMSNNQLAKEKMNKNIADTNLKIPVDSVLKAKSRHPLKKRKHKRRRKKFLGIF